jgi:hypothetical protein
LSLLTDTACDLTLLLPRNIGFIRSCGYNKY